MSTLLFPGETKPNINHTIISPIIPKYNNIVNWGEITGKVEDQEDIIDYVENELNEFDKVITTNLKRKQDIIEDLDEIRRGSNLGKTALQTISTKYVKDLKDGSEYIKRSETDDKIEQAKNSIIGEGQLPSGLDSVIKIANQTKQNSNQLEQLSDTIDSKISDLVGSAPETLNTLEELAAAFKENKNVVDFLKQSITNKQDKLVSGTNIKTINGKELLGEGNIEINGGVKIVSSVDELDPNAPSGSLATVSNTKTEEIEVEDKFSVRDVYVDENPDCEPLMELKLKVPETWPIETPMLIFGPKGYNNTNELIQGRFLGIGLAAEVVYIIVVENGSPILAISPPVIDYSIVEETLTQVNEIIASWGGIVLYGTEGESLELLAPTEEQIEGIDSFIGYNNGTHIETIETHTNDIYFKENSGWRKINDVKIVESVDKLDKNAPQGSLASVNVNLVGEALFSELYQPTSDEVNTETNVIDTTNLSKVSGISINSSYDTSIEVAGFAVYLFSKEFDGHGGVGQIVALVVGGAIILDLATQEQQSLELFTLNEDGTIIVNEENLAIINNLLSSTEFVYGGVVSMDNGESLDPSYSDVFYKTISSIQKTDFYIKEVGGWKVFDEELKAKVDNLQTIVDNFEDKTDLIVNSVDELPQDAPLGSLASVIALKTSAIPISKDFAPGKTVKEFVWNIPKKLSKEFLDSYNTNYGTILDFEETYQIDIISFETYASYPSLIYRYYPSTVVIAKYDTEGNLLSLNENSIEYINSVTKTYAIGTRNPERLDIFLSVPKTENCTYLYIKNETGWEQYSELVDQSVTTEKVADGAITMENLAEDVHETLANMITAEHAEGEEVTDYVLMASDVEQSLGDTANPISQAAVKSAINYIENMIVSVINTPT